MQSAFHGDRVLVIPKNWENVMSYLFPIGPITGVEMFVRDLLRTALIVIGFVAANAALSVSPETSLALVWIVGSILAAAAFWSTWQTAYWRLRDLGLGTEGAIAGVVGLYCVIPGIVTCASPDTFFLFALAALLVFLYCAPTGSFARWSAGGNHQMTPGVTK
jgi:uncharacterized membrane protein YhaH (DUF805 family)